MPPEFGCLHGHFMTPGLGFVVPVTPPELMTASGRTFNYQGLIYSPNTHSKGHV